MLREKSMSRKHRPSMILQTAWETAVPKAGAPTAGRAPCPTPMTFVPSVNHLSYMHLHFLHITV